MQLASSHMRSPCFWEAWSREVTRFAIPMRDRQQLTHTQIQTHSQGVGRGVKTQSAIDKRMIVHTRTDANRRRHCMRAASSVR